MTRVLSYRAFRIITAEFGSPPDVSRLCEKTAAELRRLPNLGTITLHEIEQWLAYYGKSIDRSEHPPYARHDGLTWGTVTATKKAIRAARAKARREDIERRRCPCCGHIRKQIT